MGIIGGGADRPESLEHITAQRGASPEILAQYLIGLAEFEPGVTREYVKAPGERYYRTRQVSSLIEDRRYDDNLYFATDDVQRAEQRIAEIEGWSKEYSEEKALEKYKSDRDYYRRELGRNQVKATNLEGLLSLLSQAELDEEYSDLLMTAENRLQHEHAETENQGIEAPTKLSGEDFKELALVRANSYLEMKEETLARLQNPKDAEWIEGLNEFAISQGVKFPNTQEVKLEAVQ